MFDRPYESCEEFYNEDDMFMEMDDEEYDDYQQDLEAEAEDRMLGWDMWEPW